MRLLLILPLLLAGCTAVPATPAPTRTACGSAVANGPLPDWALAGFSGDSSMPHVLGDRGAIVAALFGAPLTAGRTDGKANKILWVAREEYPSGDLRIEARLDGTTVTESRTVAGGPGPSIVDLPRPGCWRLTLAWPGHDDTMDLVYH